MHVHLYRSYHKHRKWFDIVAECLHKRFMVSCFTRLLPWSLSRLRRQIVKLWQKQFSFLRTYKPYGVPLGRHHSSHLRDSFRLSCHLRLGLKTVGFQDCPSVRVIVSFIQQLTNLHRWENKSSTMVSISKQFNYCHCK